MEFRKPPVLENKQFLFIGRLSRQKGFSDLCSIIKRFCKINSDWNFRIIGNGEYKTDFEKFIKSEKLGNRINWSLVSDDVQTEMENSSCLLMTSRFEGLPMVLIEAEVCALPAISYDTPTGPSDIILDSKTGFVVPVHNKKLFVERMKEFADDFELQQKLSYGAKTESEKFNKQNILSQWKEVLKKCER
ncbi:glycosyltransferase [Treponema sp.]|uniref:glycosyltransferase n=1 Tax=Treponema sp. TaxID=166 RepID=UPI003F0B7843